MDEYTLRSTVFTPPHHHVMMSKITEANTNDEERMSVGAKIEAQSRNSTVMSGLYRTYNNTSKNITSSVLKST